MNDFYPFMKVSLNDECGVVTSHFTESNGTYIVGGITHQGSAYRLYGLIRWDTNKDSDVEDWRGLWGSFIDSGGHEIEPAYQFQFINDDGSFKGAVKDTDS